MTPSQKAAYEKMKSRIIDAEKTFDEYMKADAISDDARILFAKYTTKQRQAYAAAQYFIFVMEK